jgi:DNA-binding transcriptional MerR regulator
VVNPAAGRRGAEPSALSIGAVLALLRPDFPDVTISKIRFLEEQGLVEPNRTPSGYRKFTHADIERLRYVLSVQRDHYMPLRVIREHLDALDRGLEPPVTGAGPGAPRLVADAAFGIEPRHLRTFRSTADREAGLVEQVVSPLRRQRGTEAAGRAEEAAREVAGLLLRLHAALVKAAVERND